MKKFLPLLLLTILFSFVPKAEAQFYSVRYREHATDCTALTDGKAKDLCYEIDASAMYKCVPDSGDCTGTEWKLVIPDPASDYAYTGLMDLSGGTMTWPATTIAGLPSAASSTNYVYVITDAATTGSCTSGSGTARSICRSNGSAWQALGGTSSGGGSGTPGGTSGQVQFNSGGAFDGINGSLIDETLNASSSTETHFKLAPTINQSGTAGYDAIELDVTETATGSGTGNLVNLKVGAASQFRVDNSGNMTLTGNINQDTSGGSYIKMAEIGSAPGTSANQGALYMKDVSGVTELFYQEDSGAGSSEVQITSGGSVNGGGGGGTATYARTLSPQDWLVHTSTPGWDGVTTWKGTFDADTAECVTYEDVLYPYDGGGLNAKVLDSMASATSGSREYELSFWCTTFGTDTADVDTESYGTVNNLTGTVPGTAGYGGLITGTSLNEDSCAANDRIVIKMCRDADDGSNDTATGDAEIRKVLIYE